MTAEIIMFPDQPETQAFVQREPAVVIVLPMIRIERLPEPKSPRTRRYPRKKPK